MPNSPTDGHVDAFRSSGSSPGERERLPTLHLLGPGDVGRALLRQLDPSRLRLVAVSDSRGTLFAPAGLDPVRTAEVKERTGSVAPTRSTLDVARLRHIGADIVVDTTATTLGRAPWYDLLQLGVLERGGRLVLAAKDAIQARVARWTTVDRERVFYNAVLGGAGDRLRDELPELRDRARGCALAGNATTTTIISVLEAGGDFDEGVAAAREARLLEADPELDFRGVDAAVKLAIVAGALLRRSIDPAGIPSDDIRELDPELVRARSRRGETTRLVGRLERDGSLSVRYEAIPLGFPLDAPVDRVAYLYDLGEDRSRLHVGDGLGAARTATAALRDLEAILDARDLDAVEATR